MVIKHSTWDAVLTLQGRLSSGEGRELDHLQAGANRELVSDILKQHLPCIDTELFDQCQKSLMPGCSIRSRILLGQRLRRRLKAQARRLPISDATLKVWRRSKAAFRRLVFRRASRRRMVVGGAMIALVGGDGAGKSTLASELHEWLAKYFDTRRVHMGKPPRSCSTFAALAVSKVISLIGSACRDNWCVQAGASAESPALFKCLWLLRRICIARDRRRSYTTARRLASNGGLVICDRYPIPEVSLMDGPQLYRRLNGGKANRVARFLVQTEERYYQDIMPPELLIVLRIDPEIAVLRKPEEDAAFVRARAQEIWEIDWGKTTAHVIDASLPKAEVLSMIKSTLWSEL
jgi:thymidylate kinase